MNPTAKNILALVAGVVGGGVVNMGLIVAGSALIPAPEGVDVTSSESIAAGIELFGPRHFLFPFLAHALGTLAGALLACKLAANRHALLAYVIGGVFLLGGISNAFMIPAPAWFLALDLVLAYIPMAWLATVISGAPRPTSLENSPETPHE